MNMDKSKLRFEFGENWEDFSNLISDQRLDSAINRLSAFLGRKTLKGCSFVDIGCGSGIHSVAAERMGADKIWAIDLDPRSVTTTKKVCEIFDTKKIVVDRADILELDTETVDKFDVVYSWGVLHHTGDMWGAIDKAAKLVSQDGYLAIALYGKTRYCEFWKNIKLQYCEGDDDLKRIYEKRYIKAFGFYLLLRGQTLRRKKEEYIRKRGMNFEHDVKDWLGGYPYDSVTPSQLSQHFDGKFELVSSSVKKRSGLFGSGCDEYLFKKVS